MIVSRQVTLSSQSWSWTFPVPFVLGNIPCFTMGGHTASGFGAYTAEGVTTNTGITGGYVAVTTGSMGTYPFFQQAIGRWK
jgi:hypothetical protein